jgi:hypothetical protein
MRGLHPGARIQLRMLKATDFQELVDAAITMEDDFKQVLEDRGKRPGLNQGGIRIRSQLLISSSDPNTGPEGMLHLVALQVGTMISFAVVAECEGT